MSMNKTLTSRIDDLKLTVIAAHAIDRAIGRGNTLPWRCKKDMQLFMSRTVNKTVLMGRKTAESIRKALPNRNNLVLTTGEKAPYKGQKVVGNFAAAFIEAASNPKFDNELVVIGGANLYAQTIVVADKICLSYIDTFVPDADTFFPDWAEHRDKFTAVFVQKYEGLIEEETGIIHPDFTYVEYQRKEEFCKLPAAWR